MTLGTVLVKGDIEWDSIILSPYKFHTKSLTRPQPPLTHKLKAYH